MSLEKHLNAELDEDDENITDEGTVSRISSPAPEKPADCPSDVWNSLREILDKDICIQSRVSDEDIQLNCEASQVDNINTGNNVKEPHSQNDIIVEFIDINDEGKKFALFNQTVEVLETVNNTKFEIQKSHSGEVTEKNVNETRKRKRNIQNWKQNVRKEKRQHGEEYVSTTGKIVPKKAVKKSGCKTEKCPFKCELKITAEEREIINKKFWSLNDDMKNHFYSKHVKRYSAKRKRTKKEESKKVFSYKYVLYVSGIRIRVCQEFFLNTLSISKNRIYYFFKKVQDPVTNIPRTSLTGKHTKKVILDDAKQKVRDHISSFPLTESHYCRANTSRKYLDRNLNIQRMYDLYKITVENPVKFHLYKSIFKSEFNISFFKPKKDLCDKCEEYKVNKNPSNDEIASYEQHIRRKHIGNQERKRDREAYIDDGKVGVLTFDLENTFSLPKANISSFFYKMKLCCYNLTAHLDKTKVVYNAIWHEFICGRAGVHIANALIKILKKVCEDNPHIEKLILWSDSCVPQNRNSILSFALQHFLASAESGNLKIIEQKYGEPGHGNAQEIDAAHSCIERFIKNIEIWSPLTLLRILLKIPKTWKLKFTVIQMIPTDYKNYQNISGTLNYQAIPYTKIKHIIYNRDSILKIKFRESFEAEFKEIGLELIKRSKNIFSFSTPVPRITLIAKISNDKKKHLLEMMGHMPEDERDFYKAYLMQERSLPEHQNKVKSTPKKKLTRKLSQGKK